jgi:hypothetical protein
LPERKVDSPEELFPGWMLLSYDKKASASSTLSGHPAANAFNEDIRTLDMGKPCGVYAVQLNFADQDAKLFGRSDRTPLVMSG